MFTQVRHDLPASALAECLEVLELVRQHSPQLLLLTPLVAFSACCKIQPDEELYEPKQLTLASEARNQYLLNTYSTIYSLHATADARKPFRWLPSHPQLLVGV